MTTKTKLYVATAFAAAIFCFSAMAELTSVVTPENDNAWVVVLPGDASAYPIQWSISGDVQDFGSGVTVSFSGCNNTTSIRVTKSQSGTFVPDFGSALGDRTVMLMITYETGFMQVWSFKYSISFPTETIGDISWCYMVDGGNATIQYAYIDSTGDFISGDVATPSTLGNCIVTAIESYAFERCVDLTSIEIPAGVADIGRNAFNGCAHLTNIVFKGNAPSVAADSFEGVSVNCVASVSPDSTGWGVDIPGTWQGMRIEYLDVVEVNGAAVEFETAADGKTRTATVAAGTTAEDVKVFVGGVDVTAGFKVSVEGTTATVVLKEPYETARSASAPYQENEDGTTVTLNVEVVPGLYYAADSAATIEALKRPGAAEPAKAGDAVVAPKQTGAQGFYKVWVSDAPIKAE